MKVFLKRKEGVLAQCGNRSVETVPSVVFMSSKGQG